MRKNKFFFSHLEFYLISSCIVIGNNDVHETQNEITGEADVSQELGNLEDIDVVEAEMATVDQKAVNESMRWWRQTKIFCMLFCYF